MSTFVCPWFIGYFLINPFRKFYQNPEKILKEYIEEGMDILEIGPGMVFFTLPIAGFTGKTGKVYAVDIQGKMIAVLKKRAAKAGYSNIIETIKCSDDSLNIEHLKGKMDFVLLFAVIHEVPYKSGLFSQIYDSIKKGGRVLMSEPRGHVSDCDFNDSVEKAVGLGFRKKSAAEIKGMKTVLLVKE